MLVLRWIRESIDSLLPVAQVGGMFIAARLLAQRSVSAPVAGASVIADITIETLTQAVFTLIGLALLLVLAEPGDVLRWAAIGLGAAAIFAGLAVSGAGAWAASSCSRRSCSPSPTAWVGVRWRGWRAWIRR